MLLLKLFSDDVLTRPMFEAGVRVRCNTVFVLVLFLDVDLALLIEVQFLHSLEQFLFLTLSLIHI